MSQDLLFDYERPDRIGLSEALYCGSKSPAQVEAAVASSPIEVCVCCLRVLMR